MTVRYTMQEMVGLAAKAEQSIDKFIKTAAVLEEHQASLQSDRSASADDKARIDQFLQQLNGHSNLQNMSPRDILVEAGVRKNQGTSSYARHHLHQLKLTYRGQS